MSSVTLEDALLFIIETYRRYAKTDDDVTTLSTSEAVRLVQAELPIFCGNNVSEDECKVIVDIIDTRKNGLIDFTEYITFLHYIAKRYHKDITTDDQSKQDASMASPAPATTS
ncbi:protein S100-A6-like [Ambystoma mexicanum]|uniref:protein S100-A6-like n=1 Tax=Ambystoma mexicanum TaxID=8296 RepID=UPI0037E72086